MGFYGNITNTNRTQFVFDKIYPNRTTMDSSTNTDSVFIGRYVLIDYDTGEGYHKNYYTDVEESGYSTDRGYDSTVWQKVFVNETEKYVMIAELNSVVPSFRLVVDAPSLDPVVPHFDADTTNIHYNLHVQPSWGFQIKKSSNSSESDEYIYQTGDKWNPEQNKTETVTQSYYGDIYYNKGGFNSDYRTEKAYNPNDSISFTPTGKTGILYNVTHNTSEIKSESCEDIYELSIRLPSIGNAVSALWDMVYGTGDKESGSSNRYRRNKNIDWNNVSGLRLVTEDKNGHGFAYNTNQIETLAGCINSAHDLIGMIINYEDPNNYANLKTYSEKILEKALTNRIYYGPFEPDRTLNNKPYKGYYRKILTYEYEEGEKEKKKVDLVDFNAGEYYYKNNNNFYLEDQKYKSGNTYYTLNNINEKKLSDKEYESGKYYYKDDSGDYILDKNNTPTKGREYYELIPSYQEEIDSKKFKFFFPTDLDYFNKYFQRTEYQDPNDLSKKRGSGLFYTSIDPDKNIQVYKPFTIGLEYKTPLYWIDNYVIEVSTDIQGNTVEVYDFEKAGTIVTEYTMVKFEPAGKYEYYWYDSENKQYQKLTSEKDIDINKVYIGFKDESINPIGLDFYWPNSGYYYKDNNSYILATESRKYDRQYYTLESAETKDILFYEPDKYYYWSEKFNEYIIDKNDDITIGREYWEFYPLYVMEDTEGVYSVGSKWNINIVPVPSHIKLGTRKEVYKWKELVGFARDLNTLHGLLLEVNNFLRLDDKYTRDTKTVQGCINTVNDIIERITELSPSKVLISDKYGRIISSNIENDNWINLTINDNIIDIQHNNPIASTESNKDNITLKFGETFEIEDWYFDEKGHKSNQTTHTIQIPKNSLIDISANGSDVITQLSLIEDTGAFTSTRNNIANLTLASYEKKDDNSDVSDVDTLGLALSKLQTQIIEEENARAMAISEEASSRENADKAEKEARETADANEKKAREDAMSEEIKNRQDAIDAEAKLRADADAAINKEIGNLKQSDITLNSRYDVLDKEVKGLINNVSTLTDSKVENNTFQMSIKELNQSDYTLNSRCNVLDNEVKQLINKVNELQERIAELEAK